MMATCSAAAGSAEECGMEIGYKWSEFEYD